MILNHVDNILYRNASVTIGIPAIQRVRRGSY